MLGRMMNEGLKAVMYIEQSLSKKTPVIYSHLRRNVSILANM